MKKILFLLLISITCYGQADFPEGLAPATVKKNSATRMMVQDSVTKEIGFRLLTNTPVTPHHSTHEIGGSDPLTGANIGITTADIKNTSTVAGTTAEAALNNLNMLKSDKVNFINIKDIGGIGDGIFDNTTIINNALITYKEVYFPDGNYLVTSLVNNLGTKISGSGVIKKSITGGAQQLNTGIDRYNYIFGQEYLSFVQGKQLADLSFLSVPIKVSWTGDSTTFGDATTTPYNLNNLFLSLANEKGISNITSLNRGHSGANTEQWRTTYLASELAENPDLYIIRYGINDPYYLKSGSLAPSDAGDTYPNRRDIGDFTTSLRSALTTIRAAKTQAQMSIILMSPNPTSDTPNGRDEKWYEQVRKVYIQAARDFKCAFIDTYGLWLDSRGASDIYMDNPYADGRAIHPKDIYNTWIVSKVFNLVYPDALLNKVSDSHFYNRSSVDENHNFSDNPSTYKRGMSLNRAEITTYGFPIDGSIFTIFHRDNTGGQFNFSRLTAIPEINFRAINFGPGEGVSLGFSNSVRMWHNGNLPFQVNGNSIYSTAPYDTDTPSVIFAKIPDKYTYSCYSVDTGTGFTGTPCLTTQKFSSSYGNQTAHFVSGSGTGKFLVRSMDAGVWSAWSELAAKAQLDLKSDLASPTFTGDPKAPTATVGDSDTSIATTAFVNSAISAAVATSGNYTPTFANVANTASISGAGTCSYTKIGNIVTATITFNSTATVTATNTQFTATLPINRATSTTLYVGSGAKLSGSSGIASDACTVVSTATNTAQISYVSSSTNSGGGSATIQYDVTK